jgi:hypothetical protein
MAWQARTLAFVGRLIVAFAFALAFAACSGGGTAGPPTPGPTPTRAAVSQSDTAYARTVCGAFSQYLGAINSAAQQDPKLFSDQAKLLRVAAPILETFGKDLNRAKPPKDMENFHHAVVERVQTIAKKAKSGGVASTSELSNISKGAPLPPVTVRERLVEASANLPECAQSGGMDALFGAS